MYQNFIQIAGIKSLVEANLLIDLGVEFIGFPLRLPVNKEDTTEAEAKEIIKQIKNRCKPILITYEKTAESVIEFANYLDVEIVQLHGPVELSEIKKIKENSNLQLIKSLVVREDNVEQLEDDVKLFSNYVDAFITDTYNPATRATGATGKTHDWNVSKRLIEISPIPVILAGGLNPKNVKQAILEVKPSGVDSHTGVENSEGDKTIELVKTFMKNCREGFSEISL